MTAPGAARVCRTIAAVNARGHRRTGPMGLVPVASPGGAVSRGAPRARAGGPARRVHGASRARPILVDDARAGFPRGGEARAAAGPALPVGRVAPGGWAQRRSHGG